MHVRFIETRLCARRATGDRRRRAKRITSCLAVAAALCGSVHAQVRDVTPEGPGPSAEPIVTVKPGGWRLLYTIDLTTSLGHTPLATSICFDPVTQCLLIPDGGHTFVLLGVLGSVKSTIDLSATAFPTLDNGGLEFDLRGRKFVYANGLLSATNESLFEFDSNEDLLSTRSLPNLVEAVALARDPRTQHLFLVDVGNSSSNRLLREYALSDGAYQEVASTVLPNSIISFGDAGMAYNPWTGGLAIAGMGTTNDGKIYDVSVNGVVRSVFFDTGITAGVSGLDFDRHGKMMFVLGFDSRRTVYVYKSQAIPLVGHANSLCPVGGC